jgi:hypothetical protein
MNQTIVWSTIRYFFIGLGMLMTGIGIATKGDVQQIIDIVGPATPAIMSLATLIWGWYVNWGTKSVPEAVAMRPDVPTVSSATGKLEAETKFMAPLPMPDMPPAVGLMSAVKTPRDYSVLGVPLPYTIAAWKVPFAVQRIVAAGMWKRLSYDLAVKINNAATNRTDLVITKQDLDGLPDDAWSYLRSQISS